jgi:DNA-binding Xre family transcriptional regulator
MSKKPVLINFAKLGVLLEHQGKKWMYLRDHGISPGIVDKLRHGTGHIDTRTIQDVCALLGCQPGDIMTYELPKDPGITESKL